MSFRRQADNFMKWREGGVVPVDAFFRIAPRALIARQNRLTRLPKGEYHFCPPNDQFYESSKSSIDTPISSAFRSQKSIKTSKWHFFWRTPSEPILLGPLKIKNGEQKKWLTLIAVEEEMLSDGITPPTIPGIRDTDLPSIIHAAMHKIWGPYPSDVCEIHRRRWKITHSDRI